MTQAQFEINEIKSIENYIQVDASQTDSMIYNARGDWHDIWIGTEAKDTILCSLFDHCPRTQGHHCWSVLINRRRGYLFCEYSREDGISSIRFMYRYPRKRAAKPAVDAHKHTMKVSYKIVQTINGTLVATCPLDIFEWALANGRAMSVMSERRRSVLRPELRTAPKIEGLYGPMYDGEQDGVAVVRYEDAATFNQLSA